MALCSHVLFSGSPTTKHDKTDQANVEFYTDENQARRRHVRKHPQFIAIARKLWDCVDLLKSDEGGIGKDSYVEMSYKITLLMCQTPDLKDKEAAAAFGESVRANAMVDWEKDTKGGAVLLYDDFFKSMFELVDTWTESCNAEDYIECLLRLIDGICFNENGVIHFKEDELIFFDRFFSFVGDVEAKPEVGLNGSTYYNLEEEVSEEEVRKESERTRASEKERAQESKLTRAS